MYYNPRKAAVIFLAAIYATLCSGVNELPTNLIHQFPNGTWAESIAARSNGQLIVTITSSPEIFQLDPQNRCPPFLLHTFTDRNSTVGIVESSPDVFQVLAGNSSLMFFTGEAGSFSVFQFDLGALPICPSSADLKISEVAHLPHAMFPDGLTTLPQDENAILATDLNLGLLWGIDITTGESSVAIDDVLMKPGRNGTTGVDGIKIRGGELFFTNPGQNIIGKVPIDDDGHATGNSSVVVPIGGDDFAFDYATGLIFEVGGSGNLTEVVVGTGRATELTMLPGPTDCVFGRTEKDFGCLYVTTSGGDGAYANPPVLVGGAVYSVDVFQNGSCKACKMGNV